MDDLKDLRKTKERAAELLKKFKGDSYTFGLGVLGQVGEIARKQGRKASVVGDTKSSKPIVENVIDSLKKAGVALTPDRCVEGARPNAPR
jgi:alcohol dehydrogenase